MTARKIAARFGLLFVLLAGTLLLAACGDPTATSLPSSTTPAKKLNVLTTVAPLANIVLNVGGNRIQITQIIPDGTDSHTFEPAPTDVKSIAAADLIIVNGIGLETPTIKLAEANKKKDTPIVQLAEKTITQQDWVFDFSFPKDKGLPNPHLWMNPEYAKKYAQLVQDELVKLDAAGKDYYAANLKAFITQVDEMDKLVAKVLETVPAQNRKLVTYHDSFAYWAPRYKWTIIGAVQPSDFKEPTPKEITEIIDQLKKEKVPAIFGSEVFPSKVLEQIAKEAEVKFYDNLRDDDMPGDKSSPMHSYVGMMIENTKTIATALGGKTTGLDGFNTANTYQK